MENIKGLLSQEKIVLLIQIAILILLSIFYIIQGVFPSLEMIIALTILLFIWKTKQRALIKDLLPFFVLLITYQSLRGFADNLSPSQIHITDLIEWEKSIFSGVLPAYFFQSILKTFPGKEIITGIANIVYMSHFVNPIIVAIIIWNYKKDAYWSFILGMVILTYGAFITYFLFPAAPPWWATKYGYLVDQPVILSGFIYPTIIEFFGPNPVAAMPSLHMAYPTYLFFILVYLWKRKILWFGILPIMVGIATLILGHHYVIDLFVGMVYSIISFAVSYFHHLKTKTPISNITEII